MEKLREVLDKRSVLVDIAVWGLISLYLYAITESDFYRFCSVVMIFLSLAMFFAYWKQHREKQIAGKRGRTGIYWIIAALILALIETLGDCSHFTFN